MNVRPLHLALVIGFGSLAVAACSGASGTELFAEPGTSQFSTGPEGPSGDESVSPPSSSGATSSGGSSTSSSSSSSSTSSGGSTSSGSSSGGSSSGSTTSSSGSSSGGVDAGPWKSPGIYCGTEGGAATYCTNDAQVCCASGAGYACKANGILNPCGNNALAIRCDDRTDCPLNQVCCGAFDQNSGYKSIGCSFTCNSPLPGVTAVRFCDPAAPADECAEIGKTCQASGSLPGFHVCK